MLAAILFALAQDPAPVDRSAQSEEPRTGAFSARFEKLHLEGKRSDVLDRLGFSLRVVREQDPSDGVIDMGQQTFRVRVPRGYDAEKPAGLLVWMDTSPSGRVPVDWDPIVDASNLITVAPNGAGDSALIWNRAGLALAAVAGVQGRYAIDPERVYVAGVGVGARMASRLAIAWPDVFRGALCASGAAYFTPLRDPDNPRASWPARVKKPAPRLLRMGRNRTRFVLLAGSKDKDRGLCRALAQHMAEVDEFRSVTYLEVPGRGEHTPDDVWFRRALVALDARLAR